MPLVIIPEIPVWQVALFACNLLAFGALFARILFIRLVKSYPALVAWLGLNIVLALLPWFVRMDFLFYYWFFICAEGCTLFLYLFTVLELYGKVLKGLPGLASTAKALIQVIVPLSAIGSLSLLALESRPVNWLGWFLRLDRTVITSLVLFVLMITGFMVWFPIRVARNTVIYSVGYAAYLVPKGTALFVLNSAAHGPLKVVNTVCMAACTLCLAFWAVAVDRAGEASVLSLGARFHPADEARLLTQLEAINRTLSHTARE